MKEAVRPEALAREVLTDPQFEAWKLVELHGFSYVRAGELLGVSKEAIRDRMFAARMKITQRQRAEFRTTSEPSSTLTMARPVQSSTAQAIAIALLAERDGARCYLCLRELPLEYLQVEHIIARSRGGTDEPSNLGLACGECNTRKGDRIVAMLVSSRRPVYTRGE